MEAVKEVSHKERIMKALSQMPIARTDQIAKLFTNGSPLKRASENLNELEKQKAVEWEWHKRAKVWRLTTRALKSMGILRTKFEHMDHTLAIGDVYFHLQPDKFLFEPKADFTFGGKDYVFEPDFILAHNKKVWVGEVQLTPLSETGWKKKYSYYNMYFEDAFRKAKYQEWSSTGKTILPQFVCISKQSNVGGLSIPGRELKVITDISLL